jgi:hypothetical protein
VARKTKPGLDYFPMDVDFFEDEKIELISSEFGPKGENITLRLLCKVYRNGYYYQWDKDQSLLFAKRVGNGVTGALVDEVVQGLIKRSFFDKGVFDSFAVLTSKGIQTRYIDAKERAKEVVFFKEYQLIDINVLNKWNNAVIKSIIEDSNTERREEKIKEEKKREEQLPTMEINNFSVIYDIEADLLKNQSILEQICMGASRDLETAKFVLKKYHLTLQEKEQYPKSRPALIAGFKKWLLNENFNGKQKSGSPAIKQVTSTGHSGL